MTGEKPSSIGKYDVIDVIGRGGMGIVYKARDPQLGRLVAIKMMTSGIDDQPEHLRRFFREAQSTASLQHPNIVTVYALGDYGGNAYLVMEYLEGLSLDVIIAARQPLSLLEKLNIMVDVCRGLVYAHQRNIIHRDIKPGNIMVSSDGAVKIVDFGIAHIAGKNETRPGQVIGSVSYMSPEQINSKPIDCRTDIFSTAVVLYQLLTYSLPFEGENTAATLLKIVNEPPPPLASFLPIVPSELEPVILRALNKDRDERYSSADEFAADLGRVRDQVRQEILGQHLEAASTLLDTNELYKAKEQVLEILKIDRHHTRASHLLREIQQRIQRQQVSQQVSQLTEQAEQAFQQEQFEQALSHVDRALVLVEDKRDLKTLREKIQSAGERAEKLERMLAQAQTAYQQGDLELAKQSIDQVCAQAPENSKAKAWYETIQKEWAEQSRQRQIDAYVRDARREITFRRFTAALEILQRAQELAPDSPQLRRMMESATAGQEQERKRRELEELSREIEAALSRDDYSTASKLSGEALSKFPNDPRLLKLLDLVERQRRSRERKQFIDEQLTSARKLLEQNRTEELIARLEAALNQIGPDAMLESLLRAVREQREREKLETRKNDYLQSAKDLLREKDYLAAANTLEAARAELPGVSEIEDLLQFVRGEAAAAERRQKLAEIGEQVRQINASKHYEEAIALLERTLSEIPDEELKIVLADTRNAAAEFEEKLRGILGPAERLLADGKPADALRLLQAESLWFGDEPRWQRLCRSAEDEVERREQIGQTTADARRLSGKGQFDLARQRLRDCRSRYGQAPELEQAGEDIDRQQALANRKEVEKALADSRTLVAAGQFATTMHRLAAVTHLLSAVPSELRDTHVALEGEASAALVRQTRTEMEQQIARGDITRAKEILERTCTNIASFRLSELEGLLQEEIQRKAEASQALEKAQQLLGKGNWKLATEQLERAHRDSAHVPQVRAQVVGEFVRAAECALASRWRAAEQVIEHLAKLEPNYRVPSELLGKIAAGKREEAVAACLEESRGLEGGGNLVGARDAISRGLATYPGDAGLKQSYSRLEALIQQQEEKARQEQVRQEREAAVRELLGRSEEESAPDGKVAMLEDGLRKYPDEPRLEQSLRSARELQHRVNSIVNQARARERENQYQAALGEWEAVRAVYSRYPELESHLERVKRLGEEAREQARRGRVRKIEDALSSGDFEGASRLLAEARAEFPSDTKLKHVQERIQLGLKLRTKAEKTLADARRLFSKHRWEAGGKALVRVFELAKQDPVIWEHAIQELLAARDQAGNEDAYLAERILRRVSEFEPSLPLPAIVPSPNAELPAQASGSGWINKLRGAVSSFSSGAGQPVVETDSQPTGVSAQGQQNVLPVIGESGQSTQNPETQERQSGRVIEFPTVVDVRSRSVKASAGELLVSSAGSAPDLASTSLIAKRSETEARPETSWRGSEAKAESWPASGGASSDASQLDYSSLTWPEDTVRLLEKQLAPLIGPIARVLVRRAAAKSANLDELYDALLGRLENPSERETFLGGKTAVAESLAKSGFAIRSEPTGLTRMGMRSEAADLNREAIDRAARILARYVGPISSVLVRRAAARAENLATLYLLLAEHVNHADRARFLKECENS
jgi:serine/threonine protein kinase